MEIIRSIQNRIYELRGERVMLDRDLAALYKSETKVLNLSVKRNLKRFPEDCMFQLTQEEYDSLRFQFETLENSAYNLELKNKIVKPGRGQHSKYLPYAFTEQGIAMLSSVLHSDIAIDMNIAIMRAFVEIRRMALQQTDLRTQFKEIIDRLGEHDVQLSQIYDAMENLLDEDAAKRRWDSRERIGFKK
ncbi:MAG: ORF6N domain-containing protein [Bacteroidetes bacterium]|nr:ORF6N domain-containing protein [Bacteroidota bacterium]